MKAMILAAGTGTRMKPLTDSLPKALIPINNVTLLEHTVHYLKYYGVDEIIINVHHFADQVIQFLKAKNNFNIRIEVSDETDRLMDTGGGLKKAEWFFKSNEPFFLTAVDILTNINLNELLDYHIKKKTMVTLAVKNRMSTRELFFDKNMQLCGWKSNITGETKYVPGFEHYIHSFAFSVIHVIRHDIFRYIKNTEPFSIIDLYLELAANHRILGCLKDDTEWFELGRYENYKKMQEHPGILKIIDQYSKK